MLQDAILDFIVLPVDRPEGWFHFSVVVLQLDGNYDIQFREDCAMKHTIVELLQSLFDMYNHVYVLNIDKLNILKSIIPEVGARLIHNHMNVPAVIFPEDVLSVVEMKRYNYTRDYLLSNQPSYLLDSTHVNILSVKKYLQTR